CYEVWCAYVVRVRELVVVARGQVKHPIEVPRRPDVRLVPKVTDTAVPAHIRAAQFLGVVGRGVVRDDQLEVREGLAEDGFDRLREKALAIVDWHTYADARPSHGFPAMATGRPFHSSAPGSAVTHVSAAPPIGTEGVLSSLASRLLMIAVPRPISFTGATMPMYMDAIPASRWSSGVKRRPTRSVQPARSA